MITVSKETLTMYNRQKRIRLGLPVPRQGNYSPWGYDWDKITGMEIPDEKALKCLLLVSKNINDSSVRDMCAWLEQVTGRQIRKSALHTILMHRPPFDELTLPAEVRETL